MPPRPQQRLLHHVLRALPISVCEFEYVAEYGTRVLGVQRAQQLVARHTHTLLTLVGVRRFIAITAATVGTRSRPGHMADPRHWANAMAIASGGRYPTDTFWPEIPIWTPASVACSDSSETIPGIRGIRTFSAS